MSQPKGDVGAKEVLIGFVVIVLGIWLIWPSGDEAAKPSPPPKEDVNAIVACRDFAGVITEVQKGLVTDRELRERMKTIYSSARFADSKGIRAGAEAVLRAITTGTTADSLTAVRDFAIACKDVRGP